MQYRTGEVDPADLWIHCSFEPQTIALAGIRLYQFPAGTDPASFKGLTPLYAPDPAWESDADRRIDSLRKGKASFVLPDDQGNPVSECEYQIEMIRHAFKFGTAITPGIINGSTPQDEKYREVLKQNFNHVVFEDHFKWLTWKNGEERKKAMETLDWLLENDFTVRGHTLVWPWYDFPWKLMELNADTAALREAVHEHLKDKVTTLRGKLVDWDVLNEPFVIRDKPIHDPEGVWFYKSLSDVVGQNDVLRWYKTAHEIDPGVRLFINDYDIVSDGANFEQHKADLESFINMLVQHNAPLGGIGFQGHFEGVLTTPERVYGVIERFSEFGLPILITEFDVEISSGHDEELYRFTHDFLKLCFSHPNMDGFLNWGFWAGKHWRPHTALFDTAWNLRPNGKAWRDLVYNEWWTHEEGKTGREGQVFLKGFMGDYRISCRQNGQQIERTFRLEKESIIWYE
jgi:GH35 family endo-1,4-beta-xylanase